VTDARLEVLRRAIFTRISKELAEHAHVDAILRATCGDFDRDEVMIRLTYEVPALHVSDHEFRAPDGWWQALRERWAPCWWLDRHPVQYRIERVEAKVVLAKARARLPGWAPGDMFVEYFHEKLP